MKIIRVLGLLVLSCFCCIHTGYAKNPTYNGYFSLDPTTDAFWVNHGVFVARVLDIRMEDEQRIREVEIEVTNPIAGGPAIGSALTIPFKNLILGHQGIFTSSFGQEQHLAKGQYWVIYAPKAGSLPNHLDAVRFVTILEQEPAASALVRNLIQINTIRGEFHSTIPWEKFLTGTPRVAAYGLKHLLAASDIEIDHEAAPLAKLLALRDNEDTNLEVRILASHLAERLRGRATDSAAEADWALQSIKNSKQLSSVQLAHLIDDLAAVAGQRMVGGSFLLGLLQSPATRTEIRLAIIRGLQRSPFYLAKDPDEELSTTIVATYFKLLSDRDPTVRGSAAYGLSSMANDTWLYNARDPDHRRASELTKRAQEAIRQSIATERDRMALLQMDNALEQMHRRAVYAHAA